MRPIDHRTRRAALAAVREIAAADPGAGVRIGWFRGVDPEGRFLVDVSGSGEPVIALSTVALTATDVDGRVVVAFEHGDPGCPVILGRVQEGPAAGLRTVTSDGERVVIRADREIELRCGEASLVLTRAGKVLIRGNYVLSRSRGANKIKGAFVDIN